MSLEQQPERGLIPLKAIHLVLEAVDGRLTKLTFTPDGGFAFVSQLMAFSGASITEVRLLRKSGGRSGDWTPEG